MEKKEIKSDKKAACKSALQSMDVSSPGKDLQGYINTVHGSSPNFSDKPRPTFINRYMATDDYAIMPIATSVKMRKE